jgi:hypothetical protein
VAEYLKEELDVDAVLVEGARGEFSVRVNGSVVIQKKGDDFPTPARCVDAVSRVID